MFNIFKKTPQPASQRSGTEKTWDANRQKAISLAEPALLQAYPDKKNFGIAYEVFQVQKDPNSDSVYIVVYHLPNGPTDTAYFVYVDVAASKIIRAYGAKA